MIEQKTIYEFLKYLTSTPGTKLFLKAFNYWLEQFEKAEVTLDDGDNQRATKDM